MSTNREAISRVRSTHRLLSGDASINDRSILAELKGNAITVIRQSTNKRNLWATDTIFTVVPCLEMIPVPITECCGFVSDIMVARSKHKLPTISEGNYNYLIQGVFNTELTKEIKYMTPKRYINARKLKLPTKDIYYWIHDGYLYVSSEFIQEIKIVAYFESDLPTEIIDRDCACNSPKRKEKCKNPLDETFKCPGFLETAVIEMTSATLLNKYFRIPKDHSSDNKDDQTNKA